MYTAICKCYDIGLSDNCDANYASNLHFNVTRVAQKKEKIDTLKGRLPGLRSSDPPLVDV